MTNAAAALAQVSPLALHGRQGARWSFWDATLRLPLTFGERSPCLVPCRARARDQADGLASPLRGEGTVVEESQPACPGKGCWFEPPYVFGAVVADSNRNHRTSRRPQSIVASRLNKPTGRPRKKSAKS